MIYTADPTQPPMAINDRYQSLLPANSRPLEHALTGATAKLEPIPVPFDTIWDVDTAPDSLLPYLAYACSVDEWNDNWTDDTKREVIENSLWVHERKGTLGAVKRALLAMKYDATVIEWFQKSPRGKAGTFSVEVHPTTGIIADNILQIRAVIDAVKRLSAHYDVYLGFTLPATIGAYAVPVVGVDITIST
jgi:phage tail P2-like protein